MFMSLKRQQRENKDILAVGNRLADAVLKSTGQGFFQLNSHDQVLPPVSPSLAVLFRRRDFTNLTFEKLLAPVVSAKTLTTVRNSIACLLDSSSPDRGAAAEPLSDIDVRLTNADGSFDTFHYAFEFHPISAAAEPGVWLVCVTDITARVEAARELHELRTECQTQREILSGILRMGRARFSGFLQKTDASLKSIASLLKKPAREEDVFRHKLDAILDEVDRVRREAAAFNVTALEGAARIFEDALHALRNRSGLSGSDFLPLAVKLDHLYTLFAAIQSLSLAAASAGDSAAGSLQGCTTSGGTQIIEAPKFGRAAEPDPLPAAPATTVVRSLESTLQALTDQVAQEQGRHVILATSGLHLVPSIYAAAVENIAIQFIRNAVMHGIEVGAAREASGKPARGTLKLDFRARDERFELLFEDDGCGLVAEEVRASAVACGVLEAAAAARLRDREAIKLIFRSRYTTLAKPSSGSPHGTGLSIVRRCVHEAGGKIALASLPGFETRFKITLPATGSTVAVEPVVAATSAG